MKKKTYLIEFIYANGQKEEISFTTDSIEWTIEQYSRNRHIVSHQILNEDTSNSKQMLFD